MKAKYAEQIRRGIIDAKEDLKSAYSGFEANEQSATMLLVTLSLYSKLVYGEDTLTYIAYARTLEKERPEYQREMRMRSIK